MGGRVERMTDMVRMWGVAHRFFLMFHVEHRRSGVPHVPRGTSMGCFC